MLPFHRVYDRYCHERGMDEGLEAGLQEEYFQRLGRELLNDCKWEYP